MALWLRTGDLPIEYILFVLRRDVYHCLPSELDEEDWRRVATDLAMVNAIARVRKAERR